jgi:hypothetical protein
MKFLKILLLLQFLLVAGCTGVSMIQRGIRTDLYSEKFLDTIENVKVSYKQGDSSLALKMLNNISEVGLLVTEKAMRRNLMGVILFSKGNYEQAVFNFDLALSHSTLDQSLSSQVYLNLASSYYKLGLLEKSFVNLKLVQWKVLSDPEIEKHQKLMFNVAKELGRDEELLESLFLYLNKRKNLAELKADPYFEHLIATFFKLDRRGKVQFIEKYEENHPLVIGYLAFVEAESIYYKGEKEEAKEFLDWIKDRFAENEEISNLVANFFFKVENHTKMNQLAIGVVLPLSNTKKKKFGERALLGIDSGFKKFLKKTKIAGNFKLHIADSEGSGAVGGYRIRELVEKHSVGVVVGGLFSTEATKEYLEAKKNGVLFISLSQIYLPKGEKDHLLLEVPGSIESQISRIFTSKMLNKFGRRAAILYPKSSRGEAYVDEFWRKSKQNNVQVTGLVSFNKGITDYRDPVGNLLGLKYKRGRQEELDILKEIHSLEKKGSIRRIQTLKPQVDFDWIFIPAYPKEALQIIPSFSYFDAFKLRMIGGPSWRSGMLSKKSRKLGDLYFIGDDIKPIEKEFVSSFYKDYKRKPRLVEIRGYDSMKIIGDLFSEKIFETRDDLDIYLRDKVEIKGLTGKWVLDENVWIKKMSSLKLSHGKINNIFEELK